MQEVMKSSQKLACENAELRRQVRSLRSTVRRCKRSQEETKATSDFLQNIIETSLDCICISDASGYITAVNRSFLDLLGYKEKEVLGKAVAEFSISEQKTYESVTGDQVRIDDRFFEEVQETIGRLLEDGKVTNWQSYYVRRDGKVVPVEHNMFNLYDSENNRVGSVAIFRDISERKARENIQRRAHRDLERKVKERTASLEEANTALRVLLKNLDEEKRSVESKIVSNVNELVMPYLEKVRESRLDENQALHMDIALINLKDIISPFLPRVSTSLCMLTPAEIQVANFIKHGKTCKQIAEAMTLSTKTVETHRKNIRSKLGITHRKVNLRNYLLSLTG